MEKINYVKRLKEIITAIKKYHLLTHMSPENLRYAFESLGPTFIKLGQIMADREDMLSEDYCNELRKLRSQVAPMPSHVVKTILKKELKLKYYDFTYISQNPIGSASIAQVHKARLDNQSVVIKIERENIEDLMEIDIYLLKKIIKSLPLQKIKNLNIDINAFLDELLASAKKEMNFQEEEKNMLEFQEYNKNVPYIRIPKVVQKYTTHHLIVMEYMDGVKINDVTALKYLGYDAHDIAMKLSQNYIKQALDDGFYHADPHPDNLKVLNNQIVYLDFGMMGRLNAANKKIMKDCMMNIILRDYENLTHNILLFGTTSPVNERVLETDLQKLLDTYLTTGLGDIDLKEFAPSLISIIQKHHIKIPKDITLLMRGIIVLEGVLEDIAPEMNLLDALKSEWQLSSIFSKENIEKYILSFIKNTRDVKNIPEEILTMCKTINNGALELKIKESNPYQKEKNNRLNLLISTLIDIALIIACAISSLGTSDFSKTLSILFLVCFIINTIYIVIKAKK